MSRLSFASRLLRSIPFLLLLAAPAVYAQQVTICSSDGYTCVNAAGDGSDVPVVQGLYSYASGPDAKTTSNQATAIGYTANAGDGQSGVDGNGASIPGGQTAIGSQANATSEGTTAVGNGASATGTGATAAGQDAMAGGAFASAYGTGANASGGYSTATGISAQAAGNFSSAYGNNAQAQAAYSLAAGAASYVTPNANNGTALGVDASAQAPYCTAIGYGNTCTVANTMSIGNVGAPTELMNVANGLLPTDATNLSQLSAGVSALGGGAGYVNGQFVAPTYTFGTNVFNNVGGALNYLYSLDGNNPTPPTPPIPPSPPASSTDPLAVHYDNSNDSSVTFQGPNGTTLNNVAPGAVTSTSTQAINGSQLFNAEQQATNYTNQQSQLAQQNAENWAKSYTDQQVSQLNDNISRVGAENAAASALNGNYRNTQNSFAAGTGWQGGHNGLAVGYRHISDDGKMSWSVQGAISGNERSVGVGMGFGW